MAKNRRTSTIVCFLISLLVLFGSAALFGVCIYYFNHYYNTITCNLSSFTNVSYAYVGGNVRWFYQYNYQADGCGSGGGTYTVYNSDYEGALNSRAEIINDPIANCYALKNSNQCQVYMNPPSETDFVFGIVIGAIIFFIAAFLTISLLEEMCGC